MINPTNAAGIPLLRKKIPISNISSKVNIFNNNNAVSLAPTPLKLIGIELIIDM